MAHMNPVQLQQIVVGNAPLVQIHRDPRRLAGGAHKTHAVILHKELYEGVLHQVTNHHKVPRIDPSLATEDGYRKILSRERTTSTSI